MKKQILFNGLLTLCLCTGIFSSSIFAQENEEGFKSIFNGTDLSGWKGDTAFWSVQDGAITGQSTPDHPAEKNLFLVWEWGEVDDFILRLKYKVKDGNSGIQIRSALNEDGHAVGYQADLESGPKYTGAIYDEHARGMLAARGERTIISEKGEKKVEPIGNPDELLEKVKQDDWNDYEIIAKGNHIQTKINGQIMADVTDYQKDGFDRSGKLMLQIHSGPPMTVQFKDIQLKRLPLEDKKKIVLVAGRPSHGHMQHEHNAGVLLLKKCLLESVSEDVLPANYHNGWPQDPTAFDNADSILLFMDGGGNHPAIQENRLQDLEKLMKQGVGLALVHYSVEVPGDRGGDEFLKWVGGFYETGYSTNPHWEAHFNEIPHHPVTTGVQPFIITDEWYFNIRFRPDMKGITPLLIATPPDDVRRTEAAREHPGRPEIVSWCVERPDGGRGFGFTGAHFHVNWQHENFRKLVLNAILWTAKVEIPNDGVVCTVTEEDIMKNLDDKRRRN
jgi:type 1 glutamine amidotransferase